MNPLILLESITDVFPLAVHCCLLISYFDYLFCNKILANCVLFAVEAYF